MREFLHNFFASFNRSRLVIRKGEKMKKFMVEGVVVLFLSLIMSIGVVAPAGLPALFTPAYAPYQVGRY